jgi:hypothetical protein
MDYLTYYKTKHNKKRYGTLGDGGYVIVDDLSYNILICCGVDNNIDFELEFLNKNNIPCYAFDGSVNNLPINHPNIKFNKINIGPENTNTSTNLHDIINKNDDIFLKMDIETFEYRWLDTLSSEQLKKFKQIVIEFHFPFTLYPFNHLDIQTTVDYKINILKKISETHKLIHFHPNNCCGTTNYNNIIIPNVFECTYIRNDIFIDNGLNNENIPTKYDYPNVNNSEISINWPPFVNH